MGEGRSESTLKTDIIQAMAGAAILSSFTYVPILAKIMMGETSETNFFVSLLVMSYGITSFIASYLFGRAGDIVGRRMILHLGLLLSTISFTLLVFTHNPEMLFVIRVLNGFSIGIYPGALAAYAYESNVKMGRFASFGSLGWGLGTLITGYAAVFDIRLAFEIAGLFFMLAFFSALTLPKIHRKKIEVPLFPIETIKRNYPVYLAVMIRHSSAFAIWTYWPLFLAWLGADLFMIGIIQAMNSLAQFIFMLGLTDRFDCEKLVIVGLISSAITFGWFMFITNYIEMIPAQILLGFSWSCLYVGALKYVTERNVERSTASGLLTSVMSISSVLGPIIAAFYYAIVPSYYPIIMNAVVMSIIALVIFIVSSKRLNKHLDVSGCNAKVIERD